MCSFFQRRCKNLSGRTTQGKVNRTLQETTTCRGRYPESCSSWWKREIGSRETEKVCLRPRSLGQPDSEQKRLAPPEARAQPLGGKGRPEAQGGWHSSPHLTSPIPLPGGVKGDYSNPTHILWQLSHTTSLITEFRWPFPRCL